MEKLTFSFLLSKCGQSSTKMSIYVPVLKSKMGETELISNICFTDDWFGCVWDNTSRGTGLSQAFQAVICTGHYLNPSQFLALPRSVWSPVILRPQEVLRLFSFCHWLDALFHLLTFFLFLMRESSPPISKLVPISLISSSAYLRLLHVLSACVDELCMLNI